ncbi:cytochrome c biogenesis protein CcsA [Terrimonas pollutisoli]|uniref:cytochrome c biogenesis protein CcsA n=1 Tax=Terrimonas pollutisoli TaxID=3034147 RepID=UPI0023EB798F|nr:cytochrome c biogenesis protein CcsA [Terrimonas sp. H1YJ31]
MDYFGEHLLPGQLGHFFIVLSLVASLVATFAYFKTFNSKLPADSQYWKKLARYAFITEAISVVSVVAILFYINSSHLFEYKYAWQHSSRSLEPKYLLASMWEGQEGSFLLWSFWHCMLGLVLIKTSKQWEAPVMTVVSFAQFCLATMVAGLYLFGEKLGSNPFILLRDSGVLDNAPALHMNFDINQPLRQDYMSTIKDGNDLNPLLQNYWMVIHPPVLFLGFASTLIPFAFIIAGLWTKKFGDVLRPALPWSLFSLAALGIGIMMGAKWAYESLTFGGYWAWDPVENASLVPWLILVAGIHTLMIYKHSGHSLPSTYLFLFLTFIFILYSTFLTRSGILGEASVHAFTDLGMNGQLYLLLFAFTWLPAFFIATTANQKTITAASGIVLLTASYFIDAPAIAFLTILIGVGFFIYQIQKQIPGVVKEESGNSREFWMFIGALVFFLSAIVIISKTSLPVINKVFNLQLAAPEDEEMAYNQIQIFVAIILGILTAITQYLRYKNTNGKLFWKKIAVPTIISVVLASLILAFGNINYDKHGPGYLGAIWLAITGSVYAIVANAAYIWLGMKGSLKLSGGSISHFGFGLVLLGILISSSKKEILSHNTSGIAIDFGKESKEKTGENLTLIKGLPMKMGKYDVAYLGDSAHPKKQQWYYKIHFKSRTDDEEFTLSPNAFVNYKGNEGLMANPDARHYWDHDVFTYISALPNPEKNKDTASFTNKEVKIGDSIFYSKGYLILEKLTTKDNMPFEGFQAGDKATVASLKVHSFNKTSYTSEPLLINQKGQSFAMPDTVMSESLIVRINSVKEDGSGADIGIKESNAILEYVTLKAYKFPFINVLWLGIIVTAIGIIISMVRRIEVNRLKAER